MTTASFNSFKQRPLRRKRWTREEYERAAELGLFRPEERLELLEGEIVEKMPQNTPHATAICRCERLLNRIFTTANVVRTQLPLALGLRSEPEPDVALVSGSIDDYEDSYPSTAVLIIEISDSTLRVDRGLKASLSARAGIPDYWILNLGQRVLEVHRQPTTLRGRRLGYGYENIQTIPETERVSPLAAPDTSILVADLLPRRHD